MGKVDGLMFSVEMKTDLGSELERGFDVLHLEHIWSGWLGLNDTSKAVLSVLSLYQIDLANVARPPGFFNRLRYWLLLWGEVRLLRAYPAMTTLSDPHVAAISIATLSLDLESGPADE